MQTELLFIKTSTCKSNPDIEYLDETSDYKLRIKAKQRYGAYYRAVVTTDAAGRFRLTAVEPRPGVEGLWDVKATSSAREVK